jgi:hypothetical protein
MGDGASHAIGVGALVDDRTRPIARTSLSADSRWIRARAEAASIGRDAGLALGTLTLGPRGGLRATGMLEGREGASPAASRALSDDPTSPTGSFFATEGWSTRAAIALPLWRFSATGGAAWDLTSHTRLGERAELVYAHPCGCLRVAATALHRVGRVGPDAMLTVSLLP